MKFETPIVEVKMFSVEDVLTASSNATEAPTAAPTEAPTTVCPTNTELPCDDFE